MNEWVDIASLKRQWNKIRICVKPVTNQVYFHVNDMENVALGPVPLSFPFNTFNISEKASFWVQLSSGPGREHFEGKIYLDDIHIIA